MSSVFVQLCTVSAKLGKVATIKIVGAWKYTTAPRLHQMEVLAQAFKAY